MSDETGATVERPASGETVEERPANDARLEPSHNRFRIPECVLNDAEKMRTIGHRHVDYVIEHGNHCSIQENVECDWEAFANGLHVRDELRKVGVVGNQVAEEQAGSATGTTCGHA